MQVGIIGPPQSGKSTLFHSLTGVKPGIFSKTELMRGVAQVPDPRVNFLAEVYGSKKAVTPAVEYIDSPPVETGGFKQSSFRAEFLRGLEQTDALLLLIPCFLPGQEADAAALAKDLQTEFILSDLEIIESRLKRIERDIKRGVKGDLKREAELLNRCREALEGETVLRDLTFTENELKALRGFTFLTIKPVQVAINIGEDDIPRRREIENNFRRESSEEAISICASVQSEIADLPPEDTAEFLKELGLAESAGDKVVRRTREILDLISFFTANEAEARAWDLKRGLSALKAAGSVHTDMERGFIRAEVYRFVDLKEHGSEAELRAKGLIRLEGKTYIVEEGDVMLFRFKV